jgi:hypothetical protein
MCRSRDELKPREPAKEQLIFQDAVQQNFNGSKTEMAFSIMRDDHVLSEQSFSVVQPGRWVRGSTLCRFPIQCDRVERRRAGHPPNPERKRRHSG